MLRAVPCVCVRQQVSKVRNSLRATPGVVCALVDLRHGASPPDLTGDNEAQRIVARVRVRSAEAASSLVAVVQALGYEALAVSLLQPSPYTPPAQVEAHSPPLEEPTQDNKAYGSRAVCVGCVVCVVGGVGSGEASCGGGGGGVWALGRCHSDPRCQGSTNTHRPGRRQGLRCRRPDCLS